MLTDNAFTTEEIIKFFKIAFKNSNNDSEQLKRNVSKVMRCLGFERKQVMRMGVKNDKWFYKEENKKKQSLKNGRSRTV